MDALRVGFTSRAAGNLAFHILGTEADDAAREAVAAARRSLEQHMGVADGSTAYLTQVHSADVVDAAALAWGTGGADAPVADAMISADGSRPLAIMVADCLPVVFVDHHTGATAVAHAGRVGLLDGVLTATVDALVALRDSGADARSAQGAPTGSTADADRDDDGDGAGIEAWIGPSICGRCYEVETEMRAEAESALPGIAAETSWGTPALDLPQAAAAQLERRGVQVHRSEHCTRENLALFSHRRAPGEGRLAGLVWRRENTAPDGRRP
ncbi:MAG: polyphenol oxidase family protein [Micrococcus sp.]|nr:polyphenol oxidase family protein [Micrococcus sp.]